MTAPSFKSHRRQPSIFSSFSKWTGNRTPSPGRSCNSTTAYINTIGGDSRTSSSGLLCAVCLRDLHRQGIAELDCGHNFHSHCIKNVPSQSECSNFSPLNVLCVDYPVDQRNIEVLFRDLWDLESQSQNPPQAPPQFTRMYDSHKHKQVFPQQFVESHQFFKLLPRTPRRSSVSTSL